MIIITILFLIVLYLILQLREPFQAAPQGITVQDTDWQNTNKNTTYYQDQSNNEYQEQSNNEYRGQAGPCLIDDRFGYQLGFGNKTNCKGLQAPAQVTGVQAQATGVPKGSGIPVSGKKPEFTGDETSTDCLPLDLPPQVPNTNAANADFWCQYANNQRQYGAQKLYYGQQGGCQRPQSARAKCSQEYSETFYKFGDPNKVAVTKCLPWDTTNFVMACAPNKFQRKITGGCPPTYGRGLCEIVPQQQIASTPTA